MKANVSIRVTPGVRHVVVGPFRAALLDEPLGVVNQVLEPPVVEVGHGQGHQRSWPSGMT